MPPKKKVAAKKKVPVKKAIAKVKPAQKPPAEAATGGSAISIEACKS